MHPPSPFLVLALPRCRTAWLARFLSYGPWTCSHEEARHLRSMEDVNSWLSLPFVGTVETAVAPFWRIFTQTRPSVRIVVIRRPIGEVVESLLRAGAQVSRDSLISLVTRLDAKLVQVTRRLVGVLSVRYDELGDIETCRRVFEFCLPGVPFDQRWYSFLAPINIQAPLWAMENYIRAYLPQLARMARIARNESLLVIAKKELSPCPSV